MPRPEGMEDLKIENAQLCFKNFRGLEDRFNPPGRRVFNVILTPEMASFCTDAGWHVKWLRSKVPDERPDLPYMSVSVSYKYRPPKIIMICGKKKVKLDEESVGQLDLADIIHCDLVLTPNQSVGPMGTWIRAYLSVMYVTVQADPFADKYEDPISADADHDQVPWA